MPSDDPNALEWQAGKYQRLATQIADARAVAALQTLAGEFIVRARQIRAAMPDAENARNPGSGESRT